MCLTLAKAADKDLAHRQEGETGMPWAVTFAYRKLYIHSAFRGDSCPNMGPAAFWVISSACDNDSGLCFCCPQKTFHLERGRMAKNEKGTGKSKVTEYGGCGTGRERKQRLEERADQGIRERRTWRAGREEWRSPRCKMGGHLTTPSPAAHCPGKCPRAAQLPAPQGGTREQV